MRHRFTQSLPLLGTLCLLIIGSAVLFKLTPAGATIAISAEAETLPVDASETEAGIAENTEEISEDAEATGTTDRVKSQVVSKIETVQSDSFLQTNWLVILGTVAAVSVVVIMAVLSIRRSHANR